MVKILLVEDEGDLARTLRHRLALAGYQVKWAPDLAAARLALRRPTFSLVLLDIGLPDGSGFNLAAMVRQRHPLLPIIFLTSHSQIEERLHGLSLGAADYIMKPFDVRELILRLKNAIQAQGAGPSSSAKIGPALIHWETREIKLGRGKPRVLSPMQVAVLKHLWRHRGRPVPRSTLGALCGPRASRTPRTVDNIISQLRHDLGDNPRDPAFLKSLRGVGYLFDPGEPPKTNRKKDEK